MSKDIKKALEHCVKWNCADCPNREELGSGEIVCRGRLLPDVLEYVADLEVKLAEKEKELVGRKKLCDLRYEQLKKSHQDKISFTVEQLEKVYEYTANVWWVDGVSEAVCNFIDQQIKELKDKTNVKD